MDHLCENTFSRHDAVSHFLKDRTAMMAFFPDLSHLQYHIFAPQPGPHRKGSEINSLHNQIFPECAVLDLGSSVSKFFYLIIGEKADLTVPFSCMGISLDPKNLL